ncbi:MAG TPA: hypothetical protein VLR54_01055 [Methanobacteriaceae archaeon]|nr:hypothetical protein [Methanobacteriaceae archaeon]
MNPKLYKKQIEEMGIDGLEIKPNSLIDATSMLIELKEYQKILQQIKYNVRIDARKISKEYISKIDELNEQIKETKKSERKAKKNKEAQKKLLKEREDKLAPYDGLDILIDGYLVQIEDSKILLRDFIKKQVK